MTRLLPLTLLAVACGGSGGKAPGDDTDSTGVTDPNVPTDPSPPVDPANLPPTVRITTPNDGASVPRGTSVVLIAEASDPDDPATSLAVSWQIAGESACVGAPVNDAGITRCEHPILAPLGDMPITVVVEDPNGATASDNITLVVTRPDDALPSAAITSPTQDGEIFDEGNDVDFLATLDDAIGQTAQGEVAWSVGSDVVSTSSPAADGTSAYTVAGVTQGPLSVAITFTTVDALTASATRSVYINGAPAAPELATSPEDPRHHDTLSATLLNEGADPDADALTYTWSWTLDGNPTSYTTPEVPAGIVQRDQVWQVTATANDGRLTTSGSASFTINNTAPTLDGVSIAPPAPRTGQDLVASASGAADIDGDPLTESWVWTRNGVVQADLQGPVVPAERTTLGESWGVTLVVSDDLEASPAREAAVTILNTPPALSVPTILPAVAYADSALTCEASASDPDPQVVTITYAWTANGTTLSSEPTLPGFSATAGATLICTATAADGVDTTTTSASVTLANRPPSIGAVTLGPEAPQRGSTLSCAAEDVVDIDDDEVTLAYTWWVDDARVPGANASTLAGAFERDEVVRCEVTPSDAQADGATVSSPPVTIANTPPAFDTIVITPDPAYTNSPIRCEVEVVDDDDDVVSLSYAWFLADALLPAEVGAELPLFTADAGDALRCEVTADDGLDTTEASATATVQNRPAQISEATLSPTDPRVGDTFLCGAVGVFDADGDEVSLSYRFLDADGASLAGPTDSPTQTVGDVASRGDAVRCEITAFDAPQGEPRAGDTVTSPARVVINTPPVALDDPSLDPPTARVQSTLGCLPPNADDADDDPVSWRFAWYRNGDLIEGATEANLSGAFARDDLIFCAATPFDGFEEGLARTSAELIIANTPPNGTALIQPTSVQIGTNIVCQVNTSPDPDGDTVTVVQRRILVDDVVVAISTSTNAFPATGDWRRGQEVVCAATLSDGIDETEVLSPAITVQNSVPRSTDLLLNAAGPGGRVDTFHCLIEGLSDPDPEDDPTVRYAWQLNGTTVPDQTDAFLDLAALAEAEPPLLASRGDTLRCSATPTDGIDDGFTRSRERTLANTPPVVTNVRVALEAPFMDDAIGCLYDYTDADGDEDASQIRWRRNGVNASPNAGHTPLYPSSNPPEVFVGENNPEAGDTIACRVQPRDSFSSQPEVHGDPVTVAATRPSASDLSITPSPSPAVFDASFACAWNFSDPRDLADASLARWWLRTREGGQSFVGEGSTYPGPSVRRGDRVECRVIPNNGTFNGPTQTVLSDAVLNTPPPPPTISFGPAAPIAGQDAVTCTIVDQPPDVDEDTLTWRIRIRRASNNAVIAQSATSGGSTNTSLTVPGSQLAIGDGVYCTAEAFDGALPFGGGSHSALVTSETLTAVCPEGSGIHPSCPSEGCREAKEDGFLTASGKLWIEADGEVGATWCEYDLAGGNWTLAAVIADDGNDTWTWNNRAVWTDTSTFGPDDRLDRDRKTVAFAHVPLQDLLFVHEPSGEWAYYVDVAETSQPLAQLLAEASAGCQRPWEGLELVDGTIDRSGNLCSTRLHLHPEDQGGLGTCGEGASDAWGPAWSTGVPTSCPFDAPGAAGSLGPDASLPDVESPALGFADALGLNTGDAGTGENHLRIYVRSGPTFEFDEDRDLRLATPFGNDCNDSNPLVHGDAAQPCGLSARRDCSALPPPRCDTCLRQLQEGEVDGDGLYILQPGSLGPAPHYCDMTTRGGGWTLVQRTVWTWPNTSGLTGSSTLFTNLNVWRSDTLGDPTPGAGAYRLRGFQWPGQQALQQHMLHLVPRDAGPGGVDCDPMVYFATGAAFSVPSNGAVTRSTPTSQDVIFFNESTLSTTDQGPSTSCVNNNFGVPWFYGACCTTCPTYQGGYWTDSPHPMVQYLRSVPDFFGNLDTDVCPSGAALPAVSGPPYRGINDMSYFLR